MSSTGDEVSDRLGPIDYLVVEFPGRRFNGDIVPAMLDLVAAGMVRIIDLAFVAKDDDGVVTMAELEDVEGLGDLGGLADFLTGLVSEEDLDQAARELEPGSSAAVLVWENTWAVPFVEALRGSGGAIVASGRLVGSVVLDALADSATAS